MSKAVEARKLTVINAENRVVKSMATKATLALGKRTALTSTTNVQSKLLTQTSKLSVTNAKVAFTKPAQPLKAERKIVKVKDVKTKENQKQVAKDSQKLINTVQVVTSKIPKAITVSRTTICNPLSFSSNLLPGNVENIDANDVKNVLLEAEYVNDIYSYLNHLENHQTIRSEFLNHQKEMTFKMRSILIDWVINVHYQFRLLPETLYMSVSIMDRFFQTENVNKDKIQLVGVTSCFIASKFEEIYPPDLRDFVVICDQLYSKNDIIKCEMSILKTLKFELGRPLPLHFLRRYSKAAHADARIHTLGKYLMELTLVEYECAHWKPSLLAAASLYLSLRILSPNSEWNPTITYYSGYTSDQLQPYVCQLAKILEASTKSKYQNCYKKYSSEKLMCISKAPELKCALVAQMAAKVSLSPE